MNLRECIGTLLCVGIPAPRLDAETRRTLERLHVGGVILFGRNVETPRQLAALTATLHGLPSRPLVAIDHEGGRVLRVGEPFTPFPSAAAIGHTGDPEWAYRVGRAMAEELAGVGIDVNFAPVLDVHSNPANPVIGDRAFSSDPARVAAFGVAMMRGLRDGGVIPCGKHFPGHGGTETDSHRELPVVPQTRAELEDTELVPFRAAIGAAVPMLMTAHVCYPALDAQRPATLSRHILNDLLRAQLGFNGVVVSDDLEMRAIAGHQPAGRAAVATLAAGADLLLICADLHKAAEAYAAIQLAVDEDALDAALVRTAAERVAHLRAARSVPPPPSCELPNLEHRALLEAIPA
jgi:beta-N-acetylhexosaminidase